MKYEPTNQERDIFIFLDEKQRLGNVDMYHAAPYIVEKFQIKYAEASRILSLWMYYVKNRKVKNGNEEEPPRS
jgi:hypothetical protein